MMANDWFSFKQFTVRQAKAAFKVTTDSVLLGAWADLEGATRVLDIGTGTGLLALMAAQRCQAQITGVEPDRPSFEEAQTNALNSPWSSRITLVNIAIQDYNPDDSVPFDTVITNPPFVSRSLKNPDPRKALARDDFSLKPGELLQAAARLRKEEGTLQLVLPVSEAVHF
ncbi:MAG: methyltransferase, partial [Bacteroidales bacterium]|nr:methyltransferase [Bacteroidales bacterium]